MRATLFHFVEMEIVSLFCFYSRTKFLFFLLLLAGRGDKILISFDYRERERVVRIDRNGEINFYFRERRLWRIVSNSFK